MEAKRLLKRVWMGNSYQDTKQKERQIPKIWEKHKPPTHRVRETMEQNIQHIELIAGNKSLNQTIVNTLNISQNQQPTNLKNQPIPTLRVPTTSQKQAQDKQVGSKA